MSDASTPANATGALETWMAEHPWHPRIVPFLVYGLFLVVIEMVRPHAPGLYVPLYFVQCSVVLWLRWRFRRLMPELTLSFHWLAVPVGVAVAVAWVMIGHWVVDRFPQRYAMDGPHYLQSVSPLMRNVSLVVRLVGMTVIVPMLEEPFVRSLVLRSFHRVRPAAIAAVQFVVDLPVIGDWFMHSSWAKRAERHARPLGDMFDRTAVGSLSVFGVLVSTLVFVSYHLQRDWPAAIVCSLAYCLLLAATRKRGLGPVIWAHGITNTLLWLYSVKTGDWQFL